MKKIIPTKTWRLLMLRVSLTLFIFCLCLGSILWAIPKSELENLPKNIVDLHVHTAGLGYQSDIFVGPSMLTPLQKQKYMHAFGVSEVALQAGGDRVLTQSLAQRIERSKTVRAAVVLAMDGVVTEEGELDRERTQLYVPNEFVAHHAAGLPGLYFGASINPKRPDAIERLNRVHRQGAKLIKWIPCIMGFDPSDRAFENFYRRLVELDVPLLSHAGQERAFGPSEDALCDPELLRFPLDLGVRVIAAHIATTGENEGLGNFERVIPMLREYPNLYADISSLTQINKLGFLERALEEDGVAKKLVYGSDWPLQFFPLVSPYFQWPHISFREAKAVADIENLWDRDVALKHLMGVPDSVFRRTATVLGLE